MKLLKETYKNKLFNVPIEDIKSIYLTDGEWYNINGSLEITHHFNGKENFSAWCERKRVNKGGHHPSKRVVGKVSQILIAEAEYS